MRGSEEGEKHRRLWQKVLLQAYMDAISRVRSSERLAAGIHARAWLTSRDPDFLQVCAMAGLEHAEVRRKMAAHFAERDRRLGRLRSRDRNQPLLLSAPAAPARRASVLGRRGRDARAFVSGAEGATDRFGIFWTWRELDAMSYGAYMDAMGRRTRDLRRRANLSEYAAEIVGSIRTAHKVFASSQEEAERLAKNLHLDNVRQDFFKPLVGRATLAV
ncbi:MAG: hypothetical protein ABW189_03820 [Rickettsiales bacterium]